MSKASEIANNVWLGPTPDSLLCPNSDDDPTFDIFIEANDLAQSPDIHTLRRFGELSHSAPQHLEFPSSGSIVPQTHGKAACEPLKSMCQWIHKLANPSTTPVSSEDDEDDLDGDIPMKLLHPQSRRILIHCTDGYTESTLLALAYFMYAEQVPLHEAWLRLHCEKGRNFFAYPSDVAILASLQPRLVPTLPLTSRGRLNATRDEPIWLSRIDGSLPSRIVPYMYLGNLGHANNPELLKAMGIKRILSVGEPVSWTKGQIDSWGAKNLLFIDRVQDNGVDPLMKDFDRCLDFIGIPPIPPSSPFPPFTISLTPAPHRKRQTRRLSNPRPLPRRRLPLRNNLHSRSDVLARPLLPSRILLRARSATQRDYSATSTLCV